MSIQSTSLRLYFAQNNIKNIDIAEILNTSTGTVSNMLAGRFGISKENATKLSKHYGFNLDFLLTGDGTLLPSSSPQSVNIGAVVEGNKAGRDINVTATNAALQAENERLRDEVAWLREQLSKVPTK